MRILHNGIYRDMTPEEVAEMQAQAQEPVEEVKTTEERLAELEEAISLLLGGATE